MKYPTLLGLLPVAVIARTWSVTYYSGEDCDGAVVAFNNLASTGLNTCWQASPNAGARSAHVTRFDDDHDDYSHYRWMSEDERLVRFYDNKDCKNHFTDRHVIAESSHGTCVSWADTLGEGKEMGSFNIVESGKLDVSRAVLSDEYRFLKHGDRLTYRGRDWRMQQVAALFFKEIPAEEWDDNVHLPNTTRRFAEHGDIDAIGRYKFSKADRYYTDHVRLEWWNEDVHERSSSFYDYDYDEEYGLRHASKAKDLRKFASGVTGNMQRALGKLGF